MQIIRLNDHQFQEKVLSQGKYSKVSRVPKAQEYPRKKLGAKLALQ